MKDDQLANVFGAMALSLVTDMVNVLEDSKLQSASHCAAVMVIVQQPGLSIDKLRKVLQLSHSGTVRVVDRLVAVGLAIREAGPDGRTVRLSATRAGRKEFEAISERRLERLKIALKTLTLEEKRQAGVISAKLLCGSASTVFEAQHICRLCYQSVCVQRGGCPVADSLNNA
jgi:MarR family transcriptional repressor of emrRAB